MRCLHCHSSVLLLHSQLKHKHKQDLKAKEQLCLFSNETPRLVLQRQKNGRNSILGLRTNAISNPLFNIAAKIPPSKSGDITAFLQTSALLLVVYLLGNFVAPYFISKYFGFDKVDEDQKTNEK